MTEFDLINPREIIENTTSPVYDFFKVAVDKNDHKKIVRENQFQCVKCSKWIDIVKSMFMQPKTSTLFLIRYSDKFGLICNHKYQTNYSFLMLQRITEPTSYLDIMINVLAQSSRSTM